MSVKLISSIAFAALAMATMAMSTPVSAQAACIPGFKPKMLSSDVVMCRRAGIKAASFNTVLNQAKNANCGNWMGPYVIDSKFHKHVGRGRVSYRCGKNGPRG